MGFPYLGASSISSNRAMAYYVISEDSLLLTSQNRHLVQLTSASKMVARTVFHAQPFRKKLELPHLLYTHFVIDFANSNSVSC